jgi:hypothetical protein
MVCGIRLDSNRPGDLAFYIRTPSRRVRTSGRDAAARIEGPGRRRLAREAGASADALHAPAADGQGSAGGDACFLAKEQSWRTAWRTRSLLGRTTTSSRGAGAGAIATRDCASWRGIARAIACASLRQRGYTCGCPGRCGPSGAASRSVLALGMAAAPTSCLAGTDRPDGNARRFTGGGSAWALPLYSSWVGLMRQPISTSRSSDQEIAAGVVGCA